MALYETEFKKLIEAGREEHHLVVVNPRGKNNRSLGVIKRIMTLEEYGNEVSAQVVAVADISSYNSHVAEENKAKEIAKKKAAIEKELGAEINKRKTAEFYEGMAKKYSDNPRLAELVAELKELVN